METLYHTYYMMRKIAILQLLLLISFMLGNEGYAQTWIDITDSYIINPRYDNNDMSTGWAGTALSQAQQRENAEHYSKAYDTYQELTGLSAGKYRLSLSAFYRSGMAWEDYDHVKSSNKTDYQHALLYAKTDTKSFTMPLELLCADTLDSSLGGGTTTVGGTGWGWWQMGGKYVPDDMTAAAAWFAAGYYKNTLEFELAEGESSLKIGIYKNVFVSNDWTCIDNWKLEYYGEVVALTSIELDAADVTVNIYDNRQLGVTYAPANATYKKVTWSSSNESVATVDTKGVVSGVGEGTAVITATAIDGSGIEATCTVNVVDNKADGSSLIINEIMAANTDMFVDPSWNYGGWVELYNPTDKAANIGGYWVSDDPDNLKKAMLPLRIGSIPAHGFKTLWFDHADTRKDVGEHWLNTNVNMKLDAKGGAVYISDAYGNLVASQEYPVAVMRTSYARTQDGGNEWRQTGEPTPAATNVSSTFADEQIEAPVVDKNGQLFNGTLQVKVEIPEGAHLKYTTDGTAPTELSDENNDGVFTVENSTVFRFRLFKDGFLPSNVVTRSYIKKDYDYYLPVVSLVTDPDNLYDNEIGIYVTGTNGKTANQDATKRNFNMDWDRPANFEFMETDEVSFSQEVDICIAGGWSRKYEPRSFKIKTAKEYGINELDYPFFKDKPNTKNKSLLLRNGGNDNYNKYRLKDAALQEIARISQFRLNLQSYRPVHVFINGDYLAMLNMREPSNKHYGYSNYGIDMDEIDAFEMSVDSGYVQKAGTKDAFNQWYSLSANASDPLAYEQICDLVDIDDYVNYMAFKFYLYDWDWPHNNAKAFRDTNDGKFHFVTFDLDNCVDWSNWSTNTNIFTLFENKKTYTFYSRPEYNGTRITAEVEMVTIFLNMLANEDFKKKFIDTYCIVGGSVFGDEDEITNLVTEMADYIKEAMSWEWNDPTGTQKEQAQGIISAVTGNYRSKMASTIKAYSKFGLSRTATQALHLSSNVEGGKILYNGMVVPRAKFNGYVFSPVTLKAMAPGGYKFVGWKNVTKSSSTTDVYESTDEEYKLPTSGAYTLQAVYEKLSDSEFAAAGITPIRINEVSAANSMYVNDQYKRNDWIELFNTTDDSVDVAGMYLSDDEDKPQKYQIQAAESINTVIPANGHLIVWCDKLEPINQIHAGFKLAAEGGLVMITTEDGSWADTLQYGPHNGTESFGRFPDGSNKVYFMNTPTIGRTNYIASYDSVYFEGRDVNHPDAIDDLIVDNAILNLKFENGYLLIEGNENANVQLSVYSSAGIECLSQKLKLDRGKASVYAGNLSEGVYVAYMKDSTGLTQSRKFIIK